MKTKNAHFFRLIWITCVGILFGLASISTALADRANTDTGDTAAQVTQLAKQRVTLTQKNSKMVSTAAGERFRINEATLIIGEDGKQVPIFRLLVPCEVDMTLATSAYGQKRVVRRIEVLSTAENATNDMWKEPQ